MVNKHRQKRLKIYLKLSIPLKSQKNSSGHNILFADFSFRFVFHQLFDSSGPQWITGRIRIFPGGWSDVWAGSLVFGGQVFDHVHGYRCTVTQGPCYDLLVSVLWRSTFYESAATVSSPLSWSPAARASEIFRRQVFVAQERRAVGTGTVNDFVGSLLFLVAFHHRKLKQTKQ